MTAIAARIFLVLGVARPRRHFIAHCVGDRFFSFFRCAGRNFSFF